MLQTLEIYLMVLKGHTLVLVKQDQLLQEELKRLLLHILMSFNMLQLPLQETPQILETCLQESKKVAVVQAP